MLAHPGSVTTNSSKGFGVMHESPINHCAHRDGVYIIVNGVIVIDDRVRSEAALVKDIGMNEWRGVERNSKRKSELRHARSRHRGKAGTEWRMARSKKQRG